MTAPATRGYLDRREHWHVEEAYRENVASWARPPHAQTRGQQAPFPTYRQWVEQNAAAPRRQPHPYTGEYRPVKAATCTGEWRNWTPPICRGAIHCAQFAHGVHCAQSAHRVLFARCALNRPRLFSGETPTINNCALAANTFCASRASKL